MAIPIAKTPTLKGEDAINFYKNMEENRSKPLDEEREKRGQKIFDAVMKKYNNEHNCE